jgi:UDP-glucose 4-epimerase
MKNIKKQIIVTGGLGFIGLSLVKKLIKKNYYPIIIDDLSNANLETLKKIPKSKYFLIKSDVLNLKEITKKIEGFSPNVIIHLAAIHYIPYCFKNPVKVINTNVLGTESMLQLASKISIDKFIFISSAAVYKPSNKAHKENDVLKPIDVYGLSKKKAEKVVMGFCNKNNIKYTILRLFNVYGSNDLTPHFIPAILKATKNSKKIKVGNIDTFRDYIYVEDVTDIIYKIMSEKLKNSVYNIGTGINFSGRKIIQMIEAISNKKLLIRESHELLRKTDRKYLLSNIAKISNAYHWRPKFSIKKGLKAIIDDYDRKR